MAARDAAADFFNNFTQGGTHRNLNKAGIVNLTAECEHFGTCALLCANAAEPLRSLEEDLRDVGIRLNVIQNGRLLEQTSECRERRAASRLAALAFDGGHERGLFAAHECAGAEADLKVEIKAGIEDIFAKQAILSRLVDGNLETVNRDGVLCTDVDVALRCADGVTGDSHGFDDAVRVAFQNGTVHECARVALVGVTTYIFLIGIVCRCEFPLKTGGEACTATTAEAGIEHGLNDLLGRDLLRENLADCLIAVERDVLIDLLRVDHAAVAQCDTHLLCVERGLVKGFCSVFVNDRLLVEQAANDTSLEQVLFNNFRDIFRGDAAIERALRVYDHDRAECAQAEAAGTNNVDFLIQTFGADFLLQLFNDLFAVRGRAARTAADQNIGTKHSFTSLFLICTDGVFRDDIAVDDVIVDNAQCLFRCHFYVCSLGAVFIDNFDDRLELADADAARLRDQDVVKLAFVDLIRDGGENRSCACCDTAGSHADQNTRFRFGIFADVDRHFCSISNCLKFS